MKQFRRNRGSNRTGKLFGMGHRSRKRHTGRRLTSEVLESRQLLAADVASSGLLAHHNYVIPEDVNADFRLTPTDALIILNELSARASGEAPTGPTGMYPDVNADGEFTPVDALTVLNRLTSGEGVGETIELSLDISQNGRSIVNPVTKQFNVLVGDTFDVEVRYSDLRAANQRLGAASIYVDLLTNANNAFVPVISETQILKLSPNYATATSGSLVLYLQGTGGRTAQISIAAMKSDPVGALTRAIEQDLNFGDGNVSITEMVNPSTGNFEYTIRFIGENQQLVDLPNINVSTSGLVGASGGSVVGSITNIPVFSSSNTINPDALVYNLDFHSNTLGGREVYSQNHTGQYTPLATDTFDEVGGAVPAGTISIPNFNAQSLTEAFSLKMKAIAATQNASISLGTADQPGSEIRMIGLNEPVPASMILLGDGATVTGNAVQPLQIKLDVTQSGVSILDPGTRNFEVEVGQKFDLEVQYDDRRNPVDRFGVFSIYADILATSIDSFRPVLSETQLIVFSESFGDAEGNISLSLEGSSAVSVPVSVQDPVDINGLPTSTLSDRIADAISTGLGLGAVTVTENRVERELFNEDDGTSTTELAFRYTVRFVDTAKEFVDVPKIAVSTTGLTTGAASVEVQEINVFTNSAQTQINPLALMYNVDYRSRTFDNQTIYNDVLSGTYNPGNVETFNEVGAVGPATPDTSGLKFYDPDVTFTGTNFEAFSIQLQAVRPTEAATFTLNWPDAIGSEISLYGDEASSDLALTQDQVLIDLVDDTAETGDDRYGFVSGRFVINSDPPVQAVTDFVTVLEDSVDQPIDVLSNDLIDTDSGVPGTLVVTSVGVARYGTARLADDGTVLYTPFPDFNSANGAQDEFTYIVSNAENLPDGVVPSTSTGTVHVTVTPVNDPPTADIITITVPRGGTAGIPYSSFIKPQPANEGDIVSISNAYADAGTIDAIQNSVRNLVYTAPTSAIATDIIHVTMTDGTDTASTIINVKIVDSEQPVANGDRIAVSEDASTTLSIQDTLLANDTVAVGSPQLLSIDTSKTLGSVSLNAGGAMTFTYTPPANLYGVAADSFTYIITDGDTDSLPGTVTIDIVGINDAPIAEDATASIDTSIASSVTIDLSGFMSPGPGEENDSTQTVGIVSVSNISAGTVLIGSDRTSVIYTPPIGITGPQTFRYTVADQAGLMASASVLVTVTNSGGGGGGGGGTGSISGIKFEDSNENRLFDAGEQRLPGWTIYLDLNNNRQLDAGEPSTITDASGMYEFTDLPARDYVVREVLQTGWRQTYPVVATSGSQAFVTGDYVGHTTVADVDGDGDNDILVANDYSHSVTYESSVTVLLNDGAANFSTLKKLLPNNARPQAIAIADLNGDGIKDMAIASAGAPAYPTAQTNGIHIFRGTGDANVFSSQYQFVVAGDGPSDIAVTDLDGDGNMDLITANHRSNTVSVLFGTGGGGFSAPMSVAVGTQPVAVAVGDITGDGFDDLAVANYDAGSVTLIQGGSRALTKLSTITGLGTPTDLQLADLNRDGKLDLVVTDSSKASVDTYLGKGSGSFVLEASTSVGPYPESVSVADSNNDGWLDLLVANRIGDASLLVNNGAGQYDNVTDQIVDQLPDFTDTALAKSIAVADLDGQGEPDYVVAFVSGGITVHTQGVLVPGPHQVTLGDGESINGRDFGNYQEFETVVPTLSLQVNPASITELATSNTNTSQVTLTLSQASLNPVVAVLNFDGTATFNVDYSIDGYSDANNVVLTIPAGSLSASLQVTAIDDAIVDVDEDITISLGTVTGATAGVLRQGTITIADDDGATPPKLTLIAISPSEVDEGQTATLRATLSKVADEDVVVNLVYAGSAVRTSDYNAATQLIIPAGSSVGTITVATLTDNLDESDESVTVGVSTVSGATIEGVPTASLIIHDTNDSPPVVTLSASTTAVNEKGGFVRIDATIEQAASADITVNVAYTGTATRGVDYNAPTQIIIPKGSTVGSIGINMIDDTIDEPSEYFTVQITQVDGRDEFSDPLTVNLIDDDVPSVRLSVPDDNLLISEDGGFALITATLSSALNESRVVNLLYGGTAVRGVDYTGPTSITFNAQETVTRFFVQAQNNQTIQTTGNLIIQVTAEGSLAVPLSITIEDEDDRAFALRSTGTPTSNTASIVTDQQLQAMVAASLNIWQQAGLNESGLQQLRNTHVAIADLDGDMLGQELSGQITIDLNAAGFGWFIDNTPEDDHEFTDQYFGDAQVHMDLLSVLLHEQGHLLGLDGDSSALMLEQLQVGSRRLPSAADVDQAIRSMY